MKVAVAEARRATVAAVRGPVTMERAAVVAKGQGSMERAATAKATAAAGKERAHPPQLRAYAPLPGSRAPRQMGR